ncbi:homoserine dehydrogenase [Novosphingobium nitrogenifigens DSM 19370]|uniref:Homoserine dehydrogenase n=1 Tax=Novosphingobium nitrogenifigens DSM 19370 TaxID=983920 RepID=F1Z5A1_9SPHN|nr:homoserine dehydrogenase [Novosphingobium nitrogenifigens]EGD60279.1 homoserine dehydrogenase [Novosphingobium nitrogenifigens DSM 19370]
MSEPLRIALAGLGTVGGGVVRLIETNAELIARRAGRPIVITAISARNRGKNRGFDMARYAWEDDMVILGEREDVDVVVELVGGADGPALALARTTFEAGKALVTANKAMVANHGIELASRAEAAKTAFKFEAAVAGGIPVIKGLKEGAAANYIHRVYGILNGTCNYILSTMEDTGRDFADVLAEAQAKGFAEADPSFDIDGIDAAHKLAILSSIAFGTAVDFPGVTITGIRRLLAADIAQADALGYYIRLIGMAETEVDAEGKRRLFQRVHPHLVHRDHPLAHVDGATNAVVAEGNFVGRLLFQGAGAGDGPTASAVVADLIDIARGDIGAPFSIPAAELDMAARADTGHRTGKAYLRFTVADRPGTLAEIAAAMRDAGVSIESLIQKGRVEIDGEERVLVALVTHHGPESAIAKALDLLEGSPSLAEAPLVMHILEE